MTGTVVATPNRRPTALANPETLPVPANAGSDKPSLPVPPTDIRGQILAGLAIVAVGMGGMGGWAALAEIHGAVIAQGQLVPETGRKSVKHSEGGIVGEVLVRDGDTVRAGQVLLRLDSVTASARLEALTSDWLTKTAMEARLAAELAEADRIEWPAQLTGPQLPPSVAKLVADQEGLFAARVAQRTAEQGLLRERVGALEAEAGHLEQQRGLVDAELGFLRQELAVTRQLADRGNAPRIKVIDQQKDEVRLLARSQELGARSAQIRQMIAEARTEVGRKAEERRERILNDLNTVRADLARLVEERRDAENRLRTRDVIAPDDGVIVGLGSRVAGSVIGPGETIADVVPASQPLIAEVKVEPRDIRDVAAGLPVHVSLSAFDTRTVGAVPGTVVQVSADLLTEPHTQRSSYQVRIQLDLEQAKLPPDIRLVPGMPVDAQILMSSRTPLDYLLSPILTAYRNAFVQY